MSRSAEDILGIPPEHQANSVEQILGAPQESLMDKAGNFLDSEIVKPIETTADTLGDFVIHPIDTTREIGQGIAQNLTKKSTFVPPGSSIDPKDVQSNLAKTSYTGYQAPDQNAVPTQFGEGVPSMLAAMATGGPAEDFAKAGLTHLLQNAGESTLGNILKKGAIKTGSLAAGGAAAGVATGQSPAEGALTNMVGFLPFAGLRMAGHSVINSARGLLNTRAHAGNFILKMLNDSGNNPKDVTHTPEQTAETLAARFTNPDGTPMTGVDIGTLANHPGSQKAFEFLKKIPLSGAFKQAQEYGAQAAQKGIANAGENLDHVKAMHGALLQEAQQKTAEALHNMGATQQQIQNINAQMPNRPDLHASMSMLLSPEAKADTDKSINNAVFDAHEEAKNKAKQLYKPINDAGDTRIDNAEFPMSNSAALNIAATKENLKNLGIDPLAQQKGVSSSAQKVLNMLNNKEKSGLNYNDVLDLTRDLQRIQRFHENIKNEVNAAQVGNLARSLKSDMKNHMINSGRKDLADRLGVADNFYKNVVIPFRHDNVIYYNTKSRLETPSITTKHSGQLAQRLLKPENRGIFNLLPEDARNATLFRHITSHEGFADKTNDELARLFKNGMNGTKSLLKQYSPGFYQKYQNSINNLHAFNNAHKELKDLSNNLDKQTSAHQKLSSKYEDKIAKMNDILSEAEKKYTDSKDKLPRDYNNISPVQDMLGKGLSGAVGTGAAIAAYLHPGILVPSLGVSIPSIAAARGLTKLLTDPELRDHYIKGTKFKINKDNPIPHKYLNQLEKLMKLEQPIRYGITGQALAGDNKNG